MSYNDVNFNILNKNVNFNIKSKFGEDRQNCSILNKIGTRLNKNNKYRDQIEYKTLTITRDTRLG